MRIVPGMTIFAIPFLTSFVLIEKGAPRLNVSLAEPTATYYWSTDSKTPGIKEKEKFKDGGYANYSDSELLPIMIEEAMAQWNSVRGSYLRFEMESVSGVLDAVKTDNTHNIMIKHCASSSIAAYAAPSPLIGSDGKENNNIIGDCDIVICDNSFDANYLVKTLVHEFGHCVGLGHPHSNYNAIMSYSRTIDSYKLDADDKAGAIYLYPDPAYADETSKELVGCGSIRAKNAPHAGGLLVYAVLALPVIASLIRQRRGPGQF